MRYQGWLCVPMVDGIQQIIMEDYNNSKYSIHLDSTKIYQELKDMFTSTLVLILSKWSDGFVVHIGASRVGLGCVLKQNGNVTAYFTKN